MSACLNLDQPSRSGFTAVPNELYRRLEEARLHPMGQLLILLLARHIYGWHQPRAYRSVAELVEQMGCDPRTFRMAREQAVQAGLLLWGQEFSRGAWRTWWELGVPAACAVSPRDQGCKNAPYEQCKNALLHVYKEKDQTKHHQQRVGEADDDARWSVPGPDRVEVAATFSESGPRWEPAVFEPVLPEAESEARALKVPPAAGGLLEELRGWGVNGRIAARIVDTQPAEKLVRVLQSIRERPNVRNPAGWLVAECVAPEAYAMPGATRAALMRQREAELRAARRAEEKAAREAEEADGDRQLEMVGQLVAELTQDERAELEDLARQRVRRLSSKAGQSADCPILQAEFRNLVLERKCPRPSLPCSDGGRWAGFRLGGSSLAMRG